MLRNVIWTRFVHETCLLTEFRCHLWKIISPSYDIGFGWNLERLYTFESWIQTNWVCINWTSVAPDIQVGMVEGQHWQIARFDFEGCDFHALLILFSFLRCTERYGCYIFNATGITSFQPLELTLCIKHQLKVKSVNYLQFTSFCIFHPKVPSKRKTNNIKAFIYKT